MGRNKPSSGQGHGPSQRQLRVGEMLRHALSEILQRGDISDPILEKVPVTIPEVRAMPDLRQVIVYVMPLGGLHAEEVIEALNRNRKFIRGGLARRVNLKYMPDLKFELDRSFDTAGHVDKILRRPDVARDLVDRESDDDDADGTGSRPIGEDQG